MNRNDRDWPTVRTAVDARMKELGLSTAAQGAAGLAAFTYRGARSSLADNG
jgi:hypothetical protein